MQTSQKCDIYVLDLKIEKRVKMKKTSSQMWKEKLKNVKKRSDVNGCKMESRIIKTVVALNLLKIPTLSSCEGHLDHGLPNPWIDIVAVNKPEKQFLGTEETSEYKKWQKENKILTEIVTNLINEFYSGLKSNEQVKISIKSLGYLAGRV